VSGLVGHLQHGHARATLSGSSSLRCSAVQGSAESAVRAELGECSERVSK
jgi:hypothetical protein